MQTPGREARIARLLVRNRDGELQDGADMAEGDCASCSRTLSQSL